MLNNNDHKLTMTMIMMMLMTLTATSVFWCWRWSIKVQRLQQRNYNIGRSTSTSNRATLSCWDRPTDGLKRRSSQPNIHTYLERDIWEKCVSFVLSYFSQSRDTVLNGLTQNTRCEEVVKINEKRQTTTSTRTLNVNVVWNIRKKSEAFFSNLKRK